MVVLVSDCGLFGGPQLMGLGNGQGSWSGQPIRVPPLVGLLYGRALNLRLRWLSLSVTLRAYVEGRGREYGTKVPWGKGQVVIYGGGNCTLRTPRIVAECCDVSLCKALARESGRG